MPSPNWLERPYRGQLLQSAGLRRQHQCQKSLARLVRLSPPVTLGLKPRCWSMTCFVDSLCNSELNLGRAERQWGMNYGASCSIQQSKTYYETVDADSTGVNWRLQGALRASRSLDLLSILPVQDQLRLSFDHCTSMSGIKQGSSCLAV